MKRSVKLIVVLAASLPATFAASTSTVFGSGNSVNFGCDKNDRVIAANAFYAARGPRQWNVTKIVYKYQNSGGGEANTRFRLYNGANAVSWVFSTPDNRTDRKQGYRKGVNTPIARGNYARMYQKTWFDVFGNDPSCSRSSYFS